MAEVVKLGPENMGGADSYANEVLGAFYNKMNLWGIATENEQSDAWGVYASENEASKVLEDLEYSDWDCQCLPLGCCDLVEKAHTLLRF